MYQELRQASGLVFGASELSVLRAFYKQALTTPKPPALMNVSMTSMNVSDKSLGKEASRRELDALAAAGSILLNLDAALTR